MATKPDDGDVNPLEYQSKVEENIGQAKPANVNQPLEAKEKINVLMKEYDTLRAEILARLNLRVGLYATAFAFAVFWWRTDHNSAKVPIVVYSVLSAIWFWSFILQATLSEGIQRIQDRVNELGQDKELLVWEYPGHGKSPGFTLIIERLIWARLKKLMHWVTTIFPDDK